MESCENYSKNKKNLLTSSGVDNASSLFDSVFESGTSSNSSSQEASCPEIVISENSPSPPVSESPTTKALGFEMSDESDDESSSKEEKSSETPLILISARSQAQKRPSPTEISKLKIDEYDFECQHAEEKKLKLTSNKFFASARTKNTYNHKWSSAGDEDEAVTKDSAEIKSGLANTGRMLSTSSCLHKVKQAQQCLESGELDDFKQELEYISTTLLDESASHNLKHLSAIQLAKKCVSAEFRRFLKTQSVLDKIFAALSDMHASPSASLTAAGFLYFLARDQKNLPINVASMRLISDLLKQDQSHNATDQEYRKHVALVWSIVNDWLSKCSERTSKKVQFTFSEDTLSASLLMLEALAYISVREHSDYFKTELLNSGCLQWVTAKLDKAVLKLMYSNGSASNTLLIMQEIERCFRIFENAAAFNKKNQAYLINHRNGLLLESGAKFLQFFKEFADKYSDESSAADALLMQTLDCVCLLCRVLMNVSHENELCSKKLGQKDGFLNNCLSTLTFIAPRIVPKEKFFDICVMMYGLMVNLVERCSANRQKVLTYSVNLYEAETKTSTTMPILEGLAKTFVKHDLTARTLDEELDNELAFEEPIEDEEASNHASQSETGTGTGSSRLERPMELSEDEMLNAVQSAMNKASAHMEDSMLASYLALFVGCLLQMDQNLANEIKEWLPDKNLDIMIDQLERFLEFMKLTQMKKGAVKSIERIIQSLQILN